MPNCAVKTSLASVAWQPRRDLWENRKGPSESGEVTAPESREPKGQQRSRKVSADLIVTVSKDLILIGEMKWKNS